MLRSCIVFLVDWCVRLSWAVIALAVALAVYCTVYAAQHFAIATDVRGLFPTDLPWAQRAEAYTATFPQYEILAVVDAPSPELVERASTRLATALQTDRQHIRAVETPQGGTFFTKNGMLYLPAPRLAQTAAGLERAVPLLGAVAADPSLRGALGALAGGLAGVARGAYPLDSLAPAMNAAADVVGDALAGRPAHFSWQGLAGGQTGRAQRRFIEIAPVMNFKALQPGAAATAAIFETVERLNLRQQDQANVRLTGLVPMNDAQFATLKENAAANLAVTIGAVVLILWLALHSWRIILAAMLSVVCGLSYSAALGLYLVKSLNLISVAFFVLFIGLAVDFGIQFSVRYRAERHEISDLRSAIASAAKKAGWPLALAAAATALGFSAFLPTSYRGLSELGRIAGPGMIIAFLTSITLLPALLKVLNPPGEPRAMGFTALAPIDRFLQRWRIPVLVIVLAAVLLASPLLARLRFDFNTLHLQNPRAPAVATFLDLRRDPAAGANAVEIVARDLSAAQNAVARFSAMPEIASARTILNLVPADQAAKLVIIHTLATAIGPALAPAHQRPPPGDGENISAMLSTAKALSAFQNAQGAGGNAARRLSDLLDRLAKAPAQVRQRVSSAVVDPLKISLADLRQSLDARPVGVGSLPESLRHDWLAPDGRARVELLPKGDPDDTASVRKFVAAVLARDPAATGPAVVLYEAGNTVVRAFIEAGAFALAAIALLLWLSLGRLSDVAMTLIPLLLAALLTLELSAALGIPLNFTNIIAFPLLLGVGVAFKIYYIMAWRRGQTALVQSTLTRAVVFSAMTTATAFGSLWLSKHPGTSSMGELMLLALVCTMLAAVLFQPALMGPPRKVMHDGSRRHDEIS